MPPVITPVNSNGQSVSTGPTPSQQAARDRAIALISGQGVPQVNANAVAPEEMGAIAAPASEDAPTKGQNDTVETPKESAEAPAKPKAASPEEPLSSQYAQLARKEKALRAKVQAAETATRDREAALKAREDALVAKESEYKTNYIPKDRLTNDTLTTLLESGITYDQLTQLALNPPPQTDPVAKLALQKLQEEIKTIREAQDQVKKSYEDQQKQSYNQAVNQIRTEVKQLVMQDPQFETIKETGSVNDVVELIEKTFEKEGFILSAEEAAKEVEEYLVEEGLKIAKLQSIQKKLTMANQPSPQKTRVETKTQQPQQKTMKTLTNAVGVSRQLSVRERAILAFKGELKS